MQLFPFFYVYINIKQYKINIMKTSEKFYYTFLKNFIKVIKFLTYKVSTFVIYYSVFLLCFLKMHNIAIRSEFLLFITISIFYFILFELSYELFQKKLIKKAHNILDECLCFINNELKQKKTT